MISRYSCSREPVPCSWSPMQQLLHLMGRIMKRLTYKFQEERFRLDRRGRSRLSKESWARELASIHRQLPCSFIFRSIGCADFPYAGVVFTLLMCTSREFRHIIFIGYSHFQQKSLPTWLPILWHCLGFCYRWILALIHKNFITCISVILLNERFRVRGIFFAIPCSNENSLFK